MFGHDSRNALPKQCADADSMRRSVRPEACITMRYLMWKRSRTESSIAHMERVAKQRVDTDSMRRSVPPEACATVNHLMWIAREEKT